MYYTSSISLHFFLNNTKDHYPKWYFTLLSHSQPIFPFYTPWKHKKTIRFLVFSGSIKWENWVLAIVNIPLKLNLYQFFYFIPPQKWNLGFSGSIKWKHWPEMGLSIIFYYFEDNFDNAVLENSKTFIIWQNQAKSENHFS